MKQVCIVKASAGSGKTHALARQYIHLLLNPPYPEGLPLREILAITFTNKATLEMKERILESLKKTALADKKALLTMDQIIRNFHFFRVETIDSFIKSILSGCVIKMNLSSSFSIKKDYSDELAYSLDKVIDKSGRDRGLRNTFTRFLKQYLYAENRANWFLKRDILSTMEAMLYCSNIYGDKFIKSSVKDTGIIIKKKESLKNIKRLKDSAPEGTRQSFLKGLESFLDRNRESFDIDSIPDSFAREKFPLNKGYTLPLRVEKLWRALKEDLKEMCELESVSLLNPYIDIFDMVSDAFKTLSAGEDVIFLEELNRQAKGIFDQGTVTIGELYYRLATRFRHYLIDEFQDTSLLQWRNLVPMIEEALASGGTFFCVGDKKQAIYRFRGGDSSLLDYAENRFKRYDIEYRTLNKNFRSHREIVEFNNEVFSEKNLRKFIREKEEFGPDEEDDILRVFEDSKQSYEEENTYGYVSIEHVLGQDKEERQSIIKDKVLELVRELGKRFSYEDIAILSRDNDEVELFTAWLLENGIPVESAKTLNIKEHPYIKELISFLKFLNSPIDNLSFSSFILGDIFLQASGLTKAEMRDFIFEIRENGGSHYREFRKRFPQVWDSLIDSFFKSVGFVPLYEFTVGILARFNVMERFSESQGFFMRFLELIKEQEEVNASLPLFLDFFDRAEGDELYVDIVDSGMEFQKETPTTVRRTPQGAVRRTPCWAETSQGKVLRTPTSLADEVSCKYVNPVKNEISNGVKALTIHKSKGLEFPIVIIPFLAMDIKVGMGSRGRSFTVYPEERGLELRRLKKRYGDFSEHLYSLYREEYKKSFIDELNNIYVAFTRGKFELYIFIPEKKIDTNLAGLLIPMRDRKGEFGKKVNYKNEKRDREASIVKLPPSRYSDWTPLLEDEFIEVSRIKHRRRLLKGEVLHYILSFIGNLSHDNIGKAIGHAMERASLRFPFVDIGEYEALIKRLLKSTNLKRFFFVEDGVVYREKEIVDRFGETCRIDRLIVKEKDVRIVDYKSSRDEMESSRKQIHRYIDTARAVYPGKDVKGVLVFLDDFSAETI